MLRQFVRKFSLIFGRFDRSPVQSIPSDLHQLEKHFSTLLRQAFGFTLEESLRATIICNKAFESNLTDLEKIERMIVLVKNHFKPRDVFFNPQIFLLHYKTLHNRILVLKELDLNVNSVVVSESCFKSFLRNANIQTLRQSGFISDHWLLRSLAPITDLSIREKILSALPEDIHRKSLFQARALLLSQYLSLRLDIPRKLADQLVSANGSRVVCTALHTIHANIELLLETWLFPKQRLLNSKYLLTMDSQNARKIISRIETIGGQNAVEVFKKYPKLLDTRYSTLVANLELVLSEFSCEQVLKAVLVLSLRSGSLAQRIQLLKSTPHLQQYLSHPRVLRLVLQLKSVVRKSETTLSLNQLCVNSRAKYSFKHFVSTHLKEKSVTCFHPKQNRFDFDNAVKVMNFLSSKHVTTTQLLNGLDLLFYRKSLVQEVWANSASEQWTQNPFLLQFLIYTIERQFAFTGNGVFITGSDALEPSCSPRADSRN